MTTPRVPNGFRPAIMRYGYGAPSGIFMTETGGGLPRVSRRWARGVVSYNVSMVINRVKFNVWNAFFFKIILGGAVQFFMPQDTFGGVLEDHLCLMVPNTYRAEPVSGQKMWQVTFDIIAEPKTMNDMSTEDAQAIIDFWNEFGPDSEALLDALTHIALVSLTELAPVDD